MELKDYIDTFNIGDNTTVKSLTDYLQGRIQKAPYLKDTIFKHLNAALGYEKLGMPKKAQIAKQVIANLKKLGLDDTETTDAPVKAESSIKINELDSDSVADDIANIKKFLGSLGTNVQAMKRAIGEIVRRINELEREQFGSASKDSSSKME